MKESRLASNNELKISARNPGTVMVQAQTYGVVKEISTHSNNCGSPNNIQI
jgi:hypothetical protein